MSKKIFEPFLDMDINVQEKHITKGETCSCRNCPVALALLEQVPDIENVDVQEGRIRITFSDEKRTVNTPHEVAKAIESFDNGKGMRPLTWRLTIVR